LVELPEAGEPWLADWQRRGGIGLSATAMSVQAPRSVLDGEQASALEEARRNDHWDVLWQPN